MVIKDEDFIPVVLGLTLLAGIFGGVMAWGTSWLSRRFYNRHK